MAISIDDIRNVEFKIEKRTGYNCDEVDDFMDELATQTEELANDNIRLNKELAAAREAAKAAEEKAVKLSAEIRKLQEELEAERAKEPAVVEAAPAESTYNEPSYFKNLETTLRETLISAQRIADETVDSASRKAREIVTAAEEKAAAVEAESAAKLEEANAELAKVKAAGTSYCAEFSALVAKQNELLASSTMFTAAE